MFNMTRWVGSCGEGPLQREISPAFLSREDVDRAPVKSVIVGHLTNVIKDFHSYFPDMEDESVQLDWVRNPFLLSEANRSYLSLIRRNSWKCHVTVASR